MSDSLSKVEKTFVFNFLKNNKVKIDIKTPFLTTEALITDFNLNEILIQLDEIPPDFKEYRLDFQAFFYFQNTYHVFNSQVIKVQGKTAVIKNPESVARNLQRKYERVVVDGAFTTTLSFDGALLPLEYPVSRMFYYSEKPPVNADFTDIKIQEILSRFKAKMDQFVSANKIQMMRNYTPAMFIEELAIATGKIVFIPDTKTDLIIKNGDEIPVNICRKPDWREYEKTRNNTPDTYMNKVISDYMVALRDKGIFSVAVVPVLYRNYVVALITLVNDFKKGKTIEYNLLKYADQFSRILSYSLKYSGYFKAEVGEKQNYDSKIFDISPGGISIISDDPLYEEKLLLNHNIEMILHVDEQNIPVLAKLVRKHERLLHKFYGFMFIDISEEGTLFLEGKFVKS